MTPNHLDQIANQQASNVLAAKTDDERTYRIRCLLEGVILDRDDNRHISLMCLADQLDEVVTKMAADKAITDKAKRFFEQFTTRMRKSSEENRPKPFINQDEHDRFRPK